MSDSKAKKRMLEAQALYEQIKKDNEALTAFKDQMDAMFERMEKMLAYYGEEWMDDMLALEEAGEQIEVMGEDPIYEEIVEQDIQIKEILLKCAQYVN